MNSRTSDPSHDLSEIDTHAESLAHLAESIKWAWFQLSPDDSNIHERSMEACLADFFMETFERETRKLSDMITECRFGPAAARQSRTIRDERR